MKIAFVLVVLAVPVFVAGQSPAPEDPRPRFDTASVKPNRSTEFGRNNRFSPGRFAYVNTPLADFVSLAYGIPPLRTLGMPEWARREKFDITATHRPEYAAFSQQMHEMLQRLLEDRFSLRAHRETREMPVYELVRVRADGQLGPRLQPSAIQCPPRGTATAELCGLRIDTGLVQGKDVDWRNVWGQLSSAVGRTVIDKTGLAGFFEVTLQWTPDPAMLQSPEAVALATAAAAAATGDRITIFTALEEQLALKLQPARAPLEVLVIDALERPTPD
jgi:uncharacterized protein (TIGR03435 family)